jgi:hypothetical protein
MPQFRAQMKDGSAVLVTVENKGDVIPGFDEQGCRFVAYTTMFKGDNGLMTFGQVDKKTADASGDVNAFRYENDLAVLESCGVDVTTIVVL